MIIHGQKVTVKYSYEIILWFGSARYTQAKAIPVEIYLDVKKHPLRFGILCPWDYQRVSKNINLADAWNTCHKAMDYNLPSPLYDFI